MESKWAEDNLQTIRTLMERSAIYRRALAPVMIYIGLIGLVGALAELEDQSISTPKFILYWYGIATLALIGAFLLVRRQALRDHESFWSPPTRRVVQAMFPALFAGFVIGALVACTMDIGNPVFVWSQVYHVEYLPAFWSILYGCAIYSAGFFMPRGVKVFGLCILLLGLLSIGEEFRIDADTFSTRKDYLAAFPNLLMGFIFGFCHLVYGLYLYATERRKKAA